MNKPRKRLLTFNDPQPLRIDRRLAVEIGFLESVVLLQLEFLISISHNEREGQFWTYHTLKQLKERHFPWLSQATICRTIQSLEEKGLIVRAHHNRSGFDRTQWFALNYDGIRALASVRVGEDAPILHSETSELQNAKSVLQDAPSVLQPEPTIPERTTENLPERTTTTSGTDTCADETAVVASLCEVGVTRAVAEELLAGFTLGAIRQQIEALPFREAKEPAAVLVKSIRETWAPPAGYRKSREEQARAQSRRNAELAAAVEEAARAEADDCYWASLSSQVQEAIDEEALSSLRHKSPFLFASGKPKRMGVMFRSMLEAERREILAARMGGTDDDIAATPTS